MGSEVFVGSERVWVAVQYMEKGSYVNEMHMGHLKSKHDSSGSISYPGRCVLQDVGFQFLHEHEVVEDDNRVIVSLSGQHMLERLK